MQHHLSANANNTSRLFNIAFSLSCWYSGSTVPQHRPEVRVLRQDHQFIFAVPALKRVFQFKETVGVLRLIMADHSELVAKFQGITGAGNDVASFYLEAANWVLEVILLHHHLRWSYFSDLWKIAISSFFDSPAPPPAIQQQQKQQKQPQPHNQRDSENATAKLQRITSNGTESLSFKDLLPILPLPQSMV